METTTNNASVNNNIGVNNDNVNNVLKKIQEESLSLGAVVRNFVEVCKSDKYALYMLQTILNYHQPDVLVAYRVNDIRKAVVAAYPYKDESDTMLEKRNGIFVPIERYSGKIIAKAFYAAVGATKVPKEVKRATEEEVAAANAKVEERKQKAANTRALDKANRELLEKFWDEMMKCTEANAWDTLMKYKTACTETEVTAK
jgi:hypothetical protein